MVEFLAFENLVGDAAGAYRFLRGHERIEASHVGLLGHGEGGLTSLRLGSDLAAGTGAPAALLLLGTRGRPLDAVMLAHAEKDSQRQGLDAAVLAKFVEDMKRAIAAIKQAVRIPVIANGDVSSPHKARDVLAATGADALMIGRAAQGRPWIFREIAHFLATGRVAPPPGVAHVRDTLLEHVRALHEFYGEPAGVRIARKHLAWYAKDRPENAAFRAVVNRAETAEEQLLLSRDYFDGLELAATAPFVAAA